MREKTKAAEERTREVDAALQQLRQAVAKVGTKSVQRRSFAPTLHADRNTFTAAPPQTNGWNDNMVE